ncbi:MAG: hypothetical protein ABIR57_08690 [Aeromicrobium sp.]
MPRQSKDHYLEIHRWLAELWIDWPHAFGFISPPEQTYLHKYFCPSMDLSQAEVLDHRKQMALKHPSLPQCAGRAARKLGREIDRRRHVPELGNDKPRIATAAGRRPLVVSAVIRPEVDADAMARLFREMMRERSHSGTEDQAA